MNSTIIILIGMGTIIATIITIIVTATICYRRQKAIEQNTNEIIQILNRLELDDIYFSLKDKENRP